jgi:hypothetical protein
MPRPLRNAGSGQLFAESTALDEVALQGRGLPVQQVVSLVNQADERIGDDSRVRGTEPTGVGGQIGQIGPIRPMLSANGSHCQRLRVVLVPLMQTALTQEVLEVEQQLVETCAGDLREPKLGLARRRCRTAAFGDVLTAAAGSLDHLVVRARTLVHEPVTEGDGSVVDDGGRVERAQPAKAAAGAQPARLVGWGRAVGAVRSLGSVHRLDCRTRGQKCQLTVGLRALDSAAFLLISRRR